MIQFTLYFTAASSDYALNTPIPITVNDDRLRSSGCSILEVTSITTGFEFISATFTDGRCQVVVQRVSGSGATTITVRTRIEAPTAVTTVKIWKEKSYLNPKNNYHIDSLLTYLGTPAITINKFQYLKLEPKMSIVLDLPEEYTQHSANTNLTYCSLQRKSGEVDFATYYFITGTKWKSAHAVELELELDVLNSYLWNTDYKVSDKTLVKREHKDRWKNGTYPGGYIPVIDRYSEGIQPPLYKTAESTMYEVRDDFNLDFDNYYLIYKSHSTDENSPIDIWLCSDTPMEVDPGNLGWNGIIDPKIDFRSKYGAIIYGSDGDGVGTNNGATLYIEQGNDWAEVTLAANSAVLIINNMIRVGTIDTYGFHLVETYYPQGFLKSNFRTIVCEGLYRVRIDTRDHVKNSAFSTFTPTYVTALSYAADIHSQDGTPIPIGSIADVDRTDATLLKIIKLPYSPVDLSYYGEQIVLPGGWTTGDYSSNLKLIKCKDLNVSEAFNSTILVEPDEDHDDYMSPYNIFAQRSINTVGQIVNKDIQYETKLMHSDYLNQKFVYDSFYYEFKGEDMFDVDGPWDLNFYMNTSSNMSSKFMFNFVDMAFDHVKADNQNYTNVMSIDRNNELPIYNSAYLNYIRMGYNYDVKTKNRQLATNLITSIASTAGAIAGYVAAAGTGGATLPAAIGLTASAASGYTRLISNAVQSEQNIQQKLKSAELQGLSVLGSDDIDLLSVYTNNNKAKIVKFEVSEKVKNALYALFYHTGYVSNEYKVPAINTRRFFNYVECDLVCDKWSNNISEEVQKIIIQKFSEGVTFFHYWGPTSNTKTWDLAQVKENWEVSLYVPS